MKRIMLIRICSMVVLVLLFMSTDMLAQSSLDKNPPPANNTSVSQTIVKPATYKQSPQLTDKRAKKTSSPAYFKAKADFKRNNPKASKAEIAAFVAKWN